MNRRYSVDTQYRMDQNGWIVFQNLSGEVIPPFAVLRIEGTSELFGKTVLAAYKPDGSSDKFYMVNGPSHVSANAMGQCTWGNPVVVAYDTADTAPAVGSEWGAKSGQWTLDEDGSNFWIIGTRTHGSLNLVEAIQDHVGTSTDTTYLATMVNTATQTSCTAAAGRVEVEFNASRISQNITVEVANEHFKIVTGGHYVFNCDCIVRAVTAGGADWDTTTSATLDSSIAAAGTIHDRTAFCTLGARSSNKEEKHLSLMDSASLVTDDVVHWYITAGAGDDIEVDEATASIWRIGP